MASCPAGFEPGTQSTCHVVCPAGFRYTQEYGGEKCVLVANPTKRVTLTALPFNATDAQMQTERAAVQSQLDTIQTDLNTRRELEETQRDVATWAQGYDALQQKYATYTGATTAIGQTIRRLEAARRPPNPAEDLSTERRWLLNGDYAAPDVRFFQIALILLVLCIGSYFVFSTPVAHIVTAGLLSVGAAVGFFLKK